MPRKTKKKRTQYTDKYKAAIVKRVTVGRRDGTETAAQIATAEGIKASLVYLWAKKAADIKSASKANGKVSKKTKDAPAGDLASITSELTEAMALVARLKKRLLELLS